MILPRALAAALAVLLSIASPAPAQEMVGHKLSEWLPIQPTAEPPYSADDSFLAIRDGDIRNVPGDRLTGQSILKDTSPALATLGSELVTNGSITGSDAGATLSGIAYDTDRLVWTLSATPGTAIWSVNVTSGHKYHVKATIQNSIDYAYPSTKIPAEIQPSLGSVTGGKQAMRRDAARTVEWLLEATATGTVNLTLTTNIWEGTAGVGSLYIDDVSVKEITCVDPTVKATDTSGGIGGWQLFSGGGGFANSPFGRNSMLCNINGFQNTATSEDNLKDAVTVTSTDTSGALAGRKLVTGFRNNIKGPQTGWNLLNARENDIGGGLAMGSARVADENTVYGFNALGSHPYPFGFSVFGNGALLRTEHGGQCQAWGENAGIFIDTCDNSTIIGFWAGAKVGPPGGDEIGIKILKDSFIAGGFVAPNLNSCIRCIILGTSIGLNPLGDKLAYINLDNVIVSTGTDVPSTSVTTISGSLSFRPPVVSKVGNYTVLTADRGTSFDNSDATGQVDFTLPSDGTDGDGYCFFVRAAQTVRIIAPAGEWIAAGPTTVTTVGGNLTSTALYQSLCIEYHRNVWIARSVTGTWTPA